jgi:hypothetical protein
LGDFLRLTSISFILKQVNISCFVQQSNGFTIKHVALPIVALTGFVQQSKSFTIKYAKKQNCYK